MLKKKIWIPILILLLVVMGVGLFYRQKVATQEPVKIYKAVEVNQQIGQTGTGEQAPPQDGHFHADGTWHAGPHETPVAISAPQSETQQVVGAGVAAEFLKDMDAKYPSIETSAEAKEFLETASPEEIHARIRDMYVARHYKKYPDCTEHAAVLVDAKHYAEWSVVHQAYMDKHSELTAEFDGLADELESLFEKYNYRPAYEATHIPESERLNDMERIKVLNAQMDDQIQRRDALNREEPLKPKPQHIH